MPKKSYRKRPVKSVRKSRRAKPRKLRMSDANEAALAEVRKRIFDTQVNFLDSEVTILDNFEPMFREIQTILMDPGPILDYPWKTPRSIFQFRSRKDPNSELSTLDVLLLKLHDIEVAKGYVPPYVLASFLSIMKVIAAHRGIFQKVGRHSSDASVIRIAPPAKYEVGSPEFLEDLEGSYMLISNIVDMVQRAPSSSEFSPQARKLRPTLFPALFFPSPPTRPSRVTLPSPEAIFLDTEQRQQRVVRPTERRLPPRLERLINTPVRSRARDETPWAVPRVAPRARSPRLVRTRRGSTST